MYIKKNLISLLTFKFLLCFLLNSYSQNEYKKINIVSDNEYIRSDYRSNLGRVSSSSPNLTYNSSESTYYNSCYLDSKKANSISYEDFTINVSLKDIKPRGNMYDFRIPIRNLNAKTGNQYYSLNNPKQKQNVSDIYWGFIINVSHNGVDESITIWIKKQQKILMESKKIIQITI